MDEATSEGNTPADKARFYLDRGEAGSTGSDFQVICEAVVKMENAIKMHLNPINDRQKAHFALISSIR